MEEAFINSFWMQSALPFVCWAIGIPVCTWWISEVIRKKSFLHIQLIAVEFWAAIVLFWQVFHFMGYDMRSMDVKINAMIAGGILASLLTAGAVIRGFALRKRTING